MLKAYIGGWKIRERPEEHAIDYWFATDPEKAAYWLTKQDAENDCALFNHHQIVIPSSEGGTYTCGGFEAAEYVSGQFVVFCLAPFILQKPVGISVREMTTKPGYDDATHS